MSKTIAIISVLCIGLLFSGCTAKRVEMSFDDFHPVSMKDADILPHRREATDNRKESVVVFGYDKSNAELTEKANIKNIVSSNLENYMANIGVDLISRGSEGSKRFREEAKLYRLMSGETGVYNGPYKADYFVMGLINAIGTKSRLTTDEKKNRRCSYTANIAGTLRVYNMLERKIVKDIRFDKSRNYSEAATNVKCPITSDIISILKQATEDAMEVSKGELLNYFTSRAYILERRAKENQNIFKVSMGKNSNLVPGDKIHIYTKSISKNRLTNAMEEEERKIAQGRVTDFVNNTFAWVSVENKEQAERIRFGDIVRVEHYKTLPERIGKKWLERFQ